MKLQGTILLMLLALVGVNCTPAWAAEEITVGGIQSMTGPFSDAGVQIDAGLQDSLNIANEDGGIGGKQIKYVRMDGQYNREVAVTAFRRVAAESRPLLMYGESKALTNAVAGDIRDKLKILYTSSSFSAEFANVALNPYVFVPGPTEGDMLGMILYYIARERPGAKIAFFYSDSELGKDPIPFGRIMSKKLSLDFVGEEVAKLGALDVNAQIRDLMTKKPDYVILHGFVLDPIRAIVGQARVLGFNPTFICTFWSGTKELLERLGSFSEGLLTVSPFMSWWNEDVPMIKKIRDYNQKYYPYVSFRENSYMHGFVTGLILVECLKRADRNKELNGDGLIKALQSLKDFDTGGLSAPLTIQNNRFPVARIWRADPANERFVPVSDWIRSAQYYR